MKTPLRLIASALPWLSGCTITQTAQPLSTRESDIRQICLIEDPRVFGEFLTTYRSALEARGFSVKVLTPGSTVTSCPLTSTYYALRSWDFVTYMSHAVVVIYRDGEKAAEALYDAPKAGFALTTRIYETTESKVGTMVSQMLPTVASK
jgi:hypothetical protein